MVSCNVGVIDELPGKATDLSHS